VDQIHIYRPHDADDDEDDEDDETQEGRRGEYDDWCIGWRNAALCKVAKVAKNTGTRKA
jgi:hypothetical protein